MRLAGGIAHVLGGISAACTIGLGAVFGLSAGRLWLLPLTLLLLPFALVCVVAGWLFYTLGAFLGLWVRRTEGLYAQLDVDGLRLRDLRHRLLRHLSWDDIRELRPVQMRPFELLNAILRTGESVRLDFAEQELIVQAAARRGIPFNDGVYGNE